MQSHDAGGAADTHGSDALADADEERRYQQLQAVPADARDAAERFLSALRDRSWRVRRRAAERLVELSQKDATQSLVPRLVEVLAARGETGARNAAAEALVGIGAAAVPALVALLAHHDPDQRKFAADILGLIGQRADAGTPASGTALGAASAALATAVDDGDPNVRVSAAEALGAVGGPDASRALERALRRDEPLLQLAAISALTHLGTPPPLPELTRLMQTPSLRRVCVRALGLVDQPAARREILRALGDDGRVVVEAALAAVALVLRGSNPTGAETFAAEARRTLRELDPTQRQRLAHALSTAEDEQARRGALWCLSVLGDAAFAPAMAEAAEDDRLAKDALAALVRLGPAGARELARQVETMSGPSRQAAAEAIVRCAEPSLLPVLQDLLASSELELQTAAVTALGRTASAEALEPLASALVDPSLSPRAAKALLQLAPVNAEEVRRILREAVQLEGIPEALHALAELEGGAAVPVLRTASRSPDARLRAAAAKVAGALGGEAAAELLRIALSDEAPEVRTAAARAVGRAKDADVAVLLGRLLADEEPGIQAAALEASAEAARPELVPRLRELTQSPHPSLAIGALKALARMDRLDGELVLSAASHAEPEVVRESLVLGAALPEAVALARRSLAHARWELRAAAARVLGASGGSVDLPCVTEALAREQDPLVREALEQARVQLGRR